MTGDPGRTAEAASHDDAIAHLLAPQSVAIVGASSDPGRIGGRPVRYYRQAQFAGRLYPINPNRNEIQGYKAYPSVEDVPDRIDLAVLAIPAPQVTPVVEQCARKGARAVVVFSAGFAETTAAGAALQHELAATAAHHGVRVLGPNCLGLFNVRAGHFPTFSSFPEAGLPLPGRVGLVTQSGAYGTHVLMQARARRLGVNIWASTGNEADIDVAELVEALARDPDTDVIACYLEGVRSAAAFLRALGASHAAQKPVILMKVGRSAVGAAAAASHTASLAGSDAVFDAAIRPFGVERVDTTERLLDLAYAASRSRLPRGRRLGIVTISGGAGVLMADAAEKEGLEVPPMPAEVQQRLIAANPLGSPKNPVDITGQALNDFGLVRDHVAALLEEADYDSAVGFFTSWPASSAIGPRLQAALREGTKGRGERPMALVMLAPSPIQESYEDDGFLVFEDPSRAIAAIGGMARLAVRLAMPLHRERPELAATAQPLPGHRLSEAEAKRLLGTAGMNLLPERLVRSAAEARAAAAALGCPVAMKVASPDIAHKTEIGAVALGVTSPAGPHMHSTRSWPRPPAERRRRASMAFWSRRWRATASRSSSGPATIRCSGRWSWSGSGAFSSRCSGTSRSASAPSIATRPAGCSGSSRVLHSLPARGADRGPTSMPQPTRSPSSRPTHWPMPAGSRPSRSTRSWCGPPGKAPSCSMRSSCRRGRRACPPMVAKAVPGRMESGPGKARGRKRL